MSVKKVESVELALNLPVGTSTRTWPAEQRSDEASLLPRQPSSQQLSSRQLERVRSLQLLSRLPSPEQQQVQQVQQFKKMEPVELSLNLPVGTSTRICPAEQKNDETGLLPRQSSFQPLSSPQLERVRSLQRLSRLPSPVQQQVQQVQQVKTMDPLALALSLPVGTSTRIVQAKQSDAGSLLPQQQSAQYLRTHQVARSRSSQLFPQHVSPTQHPTQTGSASLIMNFPSTSSSFPGQSMQSFGNSFVPRQSPSQRLPSQPAESVSAQHFSRSTSPIQQRYPSGMQISNAADGRQVYVNYESRRGGAYDAYDNYSNFGDYDAYNNQTDTYGEQRSRRAYDNSGARDTRDANVTRDAFDDRDYYEAHRQSHSALPSSSAPDAEVSARVRSLVTLLDMKPPEPPAPPKFPPPVDD